MRQKSRRRKLGKYKLGSKGIVATKAFNDFLLNEAYKRFGRNRTLQWDPVAATAAQYYDDPAKAIAILKKGSNLFRTTPIETFSMCGVIRMEMDERIQKKDINISINNIIDDELPVLCAYLGVDYNKVTPNKTLLKRNPKLLEPEMTIDRQVIINRCLERYRRLAVRQRKVFQDWYSKQPQTRAQHKKAFEKYLDKNKHSMHPSHKGKWSAEEFKVMGIKKTKKSVKLFKKEIKKK